MANYYVGISNKNGNFRGIKIKVIKNDGDRVTFTYDKKVSHMSTRCLMTNFRKITR